MNVLSKERGRDENVISLQQRANYNHSDDDYDNTLGIKGWQIEFPATFKFRERVT